MDQYKHQDIPKAAETLIAIAQSSQTLANKHQAAFHQDKDYQRFDLLQQDSELEKAKGHLSRFKNDHMNRLLDLLDIPRTDLKDKVSLKGKS